MKIKLKPWGEVVNEARHHGDFNYVVNRAFGMGKDSLPWSDWVYSDAPDEAGDYFVDNSRWVRSYMVKEVENECREMPEPDEVLRYGKVITDEEFNHYFTRIRIISCYGFLWYHKMVGGEVTEFYKLEVDEKKEVTR